MNACRQNRFPSLATLCDYGMDGKRGTNPMSIFTSYRTLILTNTVTAEMLEHAMKTDNLNVLLERDDVYSSYGTHMHECTRCGIVNDINGMCGSCVEHGIPDSHMSDGSVDDVE